MRGSSMPHSSSGYCSGLGSSVGSRSICQPSTPFTERATHKCEIPRRSSTRQSRRVEPSGSSVAPALKTLLMEYGQSFPVKRRSEERRVGKECRSRWWQYHEKEERIEK